MATHEPVVERELDEPHAGKKSSPKIRLAKVSDYAARVKDLKERFPRILARLAE
ncbi:MAG: hypothetical protein H0X27_12080 [Caulobacteraceae bacterium]|nr:hypothetical protein [Caulobacteraceae bacterium]